MVLHVCQLAQQGAAEPASEAGSELLTPIQTTLLGIDVGVAVFAGVVLVAVVASRVFGSRRFSLATAPPRPNSLREDALALAVAFYLIAVLALSGMAELLRLDPESPLAGMFVGSGAQAVGLIVCVLIASKRYEGGAHAYVFGLPGVRSTGILRWSLGTAVVTIGLCPLIALASVQLFTWIMPEFEAPTHPTLIALKDDGASFGIFLALWFGAAIIAPIAEEFFFRGFLQTMLCGVFDGRWTPILITSVAFGLVHYSQPHAVPALIFLSILVGYAYERTGSLAVPILVHALFNLKTLIWQTIGG